MSIPESKNVLEDDEAIHSLILEHCGNRVIQEEGQRTTWLILIQIHQNKANERLRIQNGKKEHIRIIQAIQARNLPISARGPKATPRDR